MSIKKVLVVDDDNLFCWAIHKELTSQRLDAHITGTGEACLAAVNEHRYGMVFLDVHLPDANGIDLLRSIRKISPETRVVIASADSSVDTKETALAEGAVQFLEKPFDISAISRVVRSIFGEYPKKRKHTRYFCNMPLRLSVLAPSPEDAPFDLDNLGGTAEDVGEQGARVNTEYPLRKGQSVRLRVADEHDPFSKFFPRDRTAEVVWVTPGPEAVTAGMRFVAVV